MAILYLIFCNDKKFKIPKEDPASYFPRELGGTLSKADSAVTYKSKTILLIRHGESTWNDTFNAGDRNKVSFVLFFIPNLMYVIAMEVYFFVSGKEADSWFFDAPLSGKGVRQSEGLKRFLKKESQRFKSSAAAESNPSERAVKLLLALDDDNESHVISSNLRRAISTAAIGLSDRFARSIKKNRNDDSKIVLVPSLQEISRNPDALSILPPRGIAHPTWCDTSIPGLIPHPSSFSSLVDTAHHEGNKPVSTNGLLRLCQFCNDLFDSTKLPKSTIIAAGHSLFFRSFFQCYLPRGEEHVSKKKKLVNGGVVMFTLREASLSGGKKEYMIDKSSVVVIYGGFGKHIKG